MWTRHHVFLCVSPRCLCWGPPECCWAAPDCFSSHHEARQPCWPVPHLAPAASWVTTHHGTLWRNKKPTRLKMTGLISRNTIIKHTHTQKQCRLIIFQLQKESFPGSKRNWIVWDSVCTSDVLFTSFRQGLKRLECLKRLKHKHQQSQHQEKPFKT